MAFHVTGTPHPHITGSTALAQHSNLVALPVSWQQFLVGQGVRRMRSIAFGNRGSPVPAAQAPGTTPAGIRRPYASSIMASPGPSSKPSIHSKSDGCRLWCARPAARGCHGSACLTECTVNGVAREGEARFAEPTYRPPPHFVQATVNDQKLTEPTCCLDKKMVYYFENQGAKYATRAIMPKSASLKQNMDIMHLKAQVSDSTHSTQ